MNFQGKKLMILGGSRLLKPVIKRCQELKIYTITVDYLPNNYIHKYSDKYLNISVVDQEKVLEAAKQDNIDGIISFACDAGAITASYVAEKLGLSNVGPYESVCILQNKGRFRDFLEKNGFNVPKHITLNINNRHAAMEKVKNLTWPLIVKPTDAAGSKGVTKIDSELELDDAIATALKFSHSDEFILEEFITQKGCSSDCDAISIGGELAYIAFNAQHFDRNSNNPYVPAGFSWPSTMSLGNQNALKSEIQRLLKLLNMDTAVYNIETRESENGIPYIMEVSPRGGGNRLSEVIRYMNDNDLIDGVVRGALGDKLSIPDYQNDQIMPIGEIILHSNKNGIYKGLQIENSFKKKIIDMDIWINEGEQISNCSQGGDTFGTIIFKSDSFEDVEHIIKNNDSFVKILLENKNETAVLGGALTSSWLLYSEIYDCSTIDGMTPNIWRYAA